MLDHSTWVEEFPASITVCDAQGDIVTMNKGAEAVFADQGGKALIGASLYDCHSAPSNQLAGKES